ncbi:MAG: hypothetical protein RR087_03350 [Oscillospiraceae bacterium]
MMYLPKDSFAEALEKSKTAEPYTGDELYTYDGEEDLARILATMEAYAKKLEREGRTR